MTIETLVGALVTGVVIGALGRLVVPGRQPIGCLFTILIGIVVAGADRVLPHGVLTGVPLCVLVRRPQICAHRTSVKTGWRLQVGLDLGVHSKT